MMFRPRIFLLTAAFLVVKSPGVWDSSGTSINLNMKTAHQQRGADANDEDFDPGYHDFRTPFAEYRPNVREEERHAPFWNELAQQELAASLKLVENLNRGVAKNVILFLGDGMGISTLTAARILKGQREGKAGEEVSLDFEKFPHVGLSKTYNVDYQVPDSAGTGTAYITGVKSNAGTIGVTAAVQVGDCEASKNPENHVTSFLEWAIRDANRSAGIVTTTRITHATPACGYAKSASREWECDGYQPKKGNVPFDPNCEDIATQLIRREPGNLFNVLFGGGRYAFDSQGPDVEGLDKRRSCGRKEGSPNLVTEWKEIMRNRSKKAFYVTNKKELDALNLDEVDHVLGLFSNTHLPYVYERRSSDAHKSYYPGLVELTQKAIRILQKNPNGFALLVEGGRIDHGHHETKFNVAFQETVEFDEAIAAAREMTNLDETLMIVTADHSHTLSMAGYPVRGSPPHGFAGKADDGRSYLTMNYANGPKGIKYGEVSARPEPTLTEAQKDDYQPDMHIQKGSETHGGEDVAIYASGPMAHLIHGLHEQNYIAHVMGYASCTGPNRGHCSNKKSTAAVKVDEDGGRGDQGRPGPAGPAGSDDRIEDAGSSGASAPRRDDVGIDAQTGAAASQQHDNKQARPAPSPASSSSAPASLKLIDILHQTLLSLSLVTVVRHY